MAKSALELQLEGYRLTTAEIVYHMPDFPALLQTFVWQHLDLTPDYPRLRKFLDYWTANLDGKLHSVNVAHAPLIERGSLRHVRHQLRLH